MHARLERNTAPASCAIEKRRFDFCYTANELGRLLILSYTPLMSRWIVRLLALLAALLFAIKASAQPLPRLEPVPEPPPPPPSVSDDRTDGPAVTIQSGAQGKTEERVINGQHIVRVTTPSGNVYYLIEDLGDGSPPGGQALSGTRVPLWIIHEF